MLARLGQWLAQQSTIWNAEAFRVAGDEFVVLLRGRTIDEAATIAQEIVAANPAERVTLSAVVFMADVEFTTDLRASLDWLAEALYREEVATGRPGANLVVIGA